MKARRPSQSDRPLLAIAKSMIDVLLSHRSTDGAALIRYVVGDEGSASCRRLKNKAIECTLRLRECAGQEESIALIKELIREMAIQIGLCAIGTALDENGNEP